MKSNILKAALIGIGLGLWEVLAFSFSFVIHFTQMVYVCQETCGWKWVPSLEMPLVIRIIVFVLFTALGIWSAAGIWFISEKE